MPMSKELKLNIRNGLEAVLKICEQPLGESILDVGAGVTDHTDLMRLFYSDVYTTDFLTRPDSNHIAGDFLETNFDKQFDVVYASNVLEHQKNVSFFLERLKSVCKDDGYIVLVVPHQHMHKLLAGHLTSWTVGLLIYNLVLCGLDCSQAKVCRGQYELSIIVKKNLIEPFGDIGRASAIDRHDELPKIEKYFPFSFFHGCTADVNSINWPEEYTLKCAQDIVIQSIHGNVYHIKPKEAFKVPQAQAPVPWWY